MEGRVINYSADGALITLNDIEATLPDRFELKITQRIGNGAPCRLRWRKKQSVGVEFLRPPSG